MQLQELSRAAAFLKASRRTEWVVYAKEPFAGPEAVLAYLSRYTLARRFAYRSNCA